MVYGGCSGRGGGARSYGPEFVLGLRAQFCVYACALVCSKSALGMRRASSSASPEFCVSHPPNPCDVEEDEARRSSVIIFFCSETNHQTTRRPLRRACRLLPPRTQPLTSTLLALLADCSIFAIGRSLSQMPALRFLNGILVGIFGGGRWGRVGCSPRCIRPLIFRRSAFHCASGDL